MPSLIAAAGGDNERQGLLQAPLLQHAPMVNGVQLGGNAEPPSGWG